LEAEFSLHGWVLHRPLFQHPELRTDAGKPDHILIVILCYICAWYRPVRMWDDDNKTFIYRKRFTRDYFYHDYESWAASFGISVRTLKRVIHLLKRLGLIDYQVIKSRRIGASGNEREILVWPVPDRVREVWFSLEPGAAKPFTQLHDRFNTGHEIVDKMGQIKSNGPIFDDRWLGHPLLSTPSGTPKLIATLMWADIFHFYTPTYKIDPETDEQTAETKFRYEHLFKNYGPWATEFGCEASQFEDGARHLRSVRLITTESAPVILSNGMKTQNVAWIVPILKTVRQLMKGGAKTPRKSIIDTPTIPPNDSDFQDKLRAEFGGGGPDQVALPLGNGVQNLGGPTGNGVQNLGGLPRNGVQNLGDIHNVRSTGVFSAEQDEQQQHEGGTPVAVVFDANASNGAPCSDPNCEVEPSPNNAGAPGGSLPTDWTAQRLEELAARVAALKTGVNQDVIAQAVRKHPDYVEEKFLKYWPLEQESKIEYWFPKDKPPRKGTMGGAARLRLLDPNWDWPTERLENFKQQCRAEALQKRQAAEQARAEAEAERIEREAYQRKEASKAMAHLQALPKPVRAQVFADIAEHHQLLVDRAPGRNLEKITASSPLWLSLAEAVHYALMDLSKQKPKLPGMVQQAAGEGDEDDDEFEPLGNVTPVTTDEYAQRIIERLVIEVQDGVTTLDDLDERRAAMLLDAPEDDPLWAAIRDGLSSQLNNEEGLSDE
jgi:hypothetical protein